jgi:hypothetical protein
VQPLWNTVLRFHKKLKIELPYDSMIALLGIYLKECKSGYNRNICALMFIASIFLTAKLWNKTKCPSTNEWVKKDVVYIHNRVLFSHKEELQLCHLQKNEWNLRPLGK